MKCSLVIAFALLAVLFSMAGADVPELLSYQGVLLGASGVIVADGTYSVTFRLYTLESGGSPIWQETNDVQVKKGVFGATLGTHVSMGSLGFDVPYYLGISVAGGEELSPRQALTAGPYSLNAKAVNGSNNVFPSSGNVGIGMKAPAFPLHVQSSDIQGIRLDGTALGTWALISINAAANSSPGVEFARLNSTKATLYLDGNDDIKLRQGAAVTLTVKSSTGSLGLGIDPLEKLHVNGGIRLGNSTTEAPGTIRWTGTDYEGYDGSVWKSFTAVGGSGLPSGTSGQTLRHDGASWVSTSNLFNDGTNIGIGILSPSSRLHIYGDGTEEMKIQSSSGYLATQIRMQSPGGADRHLMIQKWGAAAGGTKAGIPLSDLSLIGPGPDAGPLLLDVANSNPMVFATNDTARIWLSPDGNLGINNSYPEAKLHVAGYARFGSFEKNGDIQLFRAGISHAMMELYPSANGGYMTMRDEVGNIFAGLEPLNSGSGGAFYLSNYPGPGVFAVRSNAGSTGDPDLFISGSASGAAFNTYESGNPSVNLPQDAVSAPEIKDEPGAASFADGAEIVLGHSATTIASQSIVVPGAGYVLAIGTANMALDHTTGTETRAVIGVSNSSLSFPGNQDSWVQIAASTPTGLFYLPGTFHGLFQVYDTGTYTFYMLGYAASGSSKCSERQLSLVYLPTAYGTVQPMLAASGADGAKTTGPALIASDINAQKTASEAVNAERLQREFIEVKERLAAIERELGNERR
jgi:hypothetical protein